MKNLVKLLIILIALFTISQNYSQGNIPFKIIKKLPVIEVLVNGKQAYLLIDTGASISLLDASSAKYFDFYTYEVDDPNFSSIGGVGGSQKVERVKDFEITVDGVVLDAFDYATNLNAARSVRGVVGILGSDYLAKHGYVVDFVNNQLRKLSPQNLVVAN